MDWSRFSDEDLRDIAEIHWQEAYGKPSDGYTRSLCRNTLIKLLENLDTYQHALGHTFTDEEQDGISMRSPKSQLQAGARG